MDQIRYCQPHLERTGEEVIAAYEVNGEHFCRSCYLGGTPGQRPRVRGERQSLDGGMIVQLCETLTAGAVARKLGVSKCAVYHHLRAHGICGRRKKAVASD